MPIEVIIRLNPARELGRLTITNDETGSAGFGNYAVSSVCINKIVHSRIEGFDHSQGVIALVIASFKAIEEVEAETMFP